MVYHIIEAPVHFFQVAFGFSIVTYEAARKHRLYKGMVFIEVEYFVVMVLGDSGWISYGEPRQYASFERSREFAKQSNLILIDC